MELTHTFSFPCSHSHSTARFVNSVSLKSRAKTKRSPTLTPALAETAVSVAIAATVVGTAATLLARTRTKAEDSSSMKECQVCCGSGICSECKGQGFVLKKQSDENAEKARLTAKNMATRYTAGLPKKWSYCTKCSSTRSCTNCGGSGKISY